MVLVVTAHDTEVTLAAVRAGSPDRVLATWAGRGRDMQAPRLSLSPSGRRAAVAARGALRTIRLADGATLDVAALPADWSADLLSRPVLGWDAAEEPVAVTTFARPVAVPLADGWILDVDGHTDGREAYPGGDHGSAGFNTPEAAAALAVPVPFRLRLRREGLEVVVHDERRAAVDGAPTLLWPPVVGPQGVLPRRSQRTGSAALRARGDDARVETDVVTREPWLVTGDGRVAVLPVRLSVPPLAALPDGTWLLPGADVLWRDDDDEPLHRLTADGALRPFVVGGAPATPRRLLVALAPDVAGPIKELDSGGDALWRFERARVDADAGELGLLLTDCLLTNDDPEPIRWVAVALHLDDRRAGRLLATGRHPDASRVDVAL